MPPEEPQASLAKNLTGGGGCGCGCLGLLAVAIGLVAIGGIYVDLYTGEGPDNAWWGGLASIVVGTGMAGLGGIMFLGSLFLD